MAIYEIRHGNLKKLLDNYQQQRGGTPHGVLKDFGALVGISGMQMSHLRTGKRNIGTGAARKIEAALKKPEGWMDILHGSMERTTADEDRFLKIALCLYRASPVKARDIILQAIKEQLTPSTDQL